MNLLFGIVQGRLTKAPKNRLQVFPRIKNIEKEFSDAKKLGFDYIELFTERKYNSLNPIWFKRDENFYQNLKKKYKLITPNLCDDYIISNNIKLKKNINYIENLILNIKKLNIKNLILPLYGKSNLKDNNFISFKNCLKKITNLAKKNNINILIESNINPKNFFTLKRLIKNKNFYFVFDTGNRVILKRNIYEDLSMFFNHIKLIHLKDKNKKNQNVKFGEGEVNFFKIFKILKKRRYKNKITFETVRGENPLKTAKKNIFYFKKLIKKL